MQAEPDAPGIGGNSLIQYRWQFAGFVFDESRLTLEYEGQPRELERKPLQVLSVLLRHAGEVVTKRELLDAVWAGRVTVEHVLATAVGKLRKVLLEAGEHCIVTVPKVGYRFGAKLERTAVGRSVSSVLRLGAGMPVYTRPNFLLERQIARTRGSEVWLAIHSKTQEARVFKFALDGERLHTLKREVTVARLLATTLSERKNYVRVLDWNFSEEPFFLECEYAGLSLAEWAEQYEGFADISRGQRLALFLQMADAVAAAHAVGVLHKDIKPGNVLIDQVSEHAWRVALTDFGSSHLLLPDRLAELEITGLGLTATMGSDKYSDSGTPLYLAPEVAAGQPPTIQSDLYALGLLLYQLLVGDFRRPLAPGWERDIADALVCEDIAAATDGNPQLRLSSVAELSRRLRSLDVRRVERASHAEQEQRTLAAQRALERTRLRRPWLITLLAVLTFSTFASSWLYLQADTARREADVESERSASTLRFLREDVIGRANPDQYGSPVNDGLLALLDQAMSGLDSQFVDDSLLRARVYETLGAAFRGLSSLDPALLAFSNAVTHYSLALGDSHPETRRARYQQAHILSWAARFDDARRVLAHADAPATNSARDQASAELSIWAALAQAALYSQTMEPSRAYEHWQRAAQLLEQSTPEDFRLRNYVRHGLVEAELRLGLAEQAESRLQRMLDDGDAPDWFLEQQRGTIYSGLARALRSQGRLEEALHHAEHGHAYFSATLGDTHHRTILGLSTLSSVYHLLNRCDEALAAGSVAFTRIREVRGERHQASLIEQLNLGAKQFECGVHEPGLANLEAAESGLVEQYGEGDVAAQSARFFRARYLLQLGRHDEALALIDGISPEALQAGQMRAGQAERMDALRGRILLAQGRHGEALPLLQRVRSALEELGNDEATLKEVATALEQFGARNMEQK